MLCPPELELVTRVSRPCICLCRGVLAPRRLASPQSLSCAITRFQLGFHTPQAVAAYHFLSWARVGRDAVARSRLIWSPRPRSRSWPPRPPRSLWRYISSARTPKRAPQTWCPPSLLHQHPLHHPRASPTTCRVAHEERPYHERRDYSFLLVQCEYVPPQRPFG